MEARLLNPAADLNPTARPQKPFTIKSGWWLIVVLIGWQLVLAIPLGITSYIADRFNVNLNGLPEALVYAGSFLLTIRYVRRKQTDGPLDFTPVKPVVFPVIAVGTIAFALLLEPLTSVMPTPDWLRKIWEEAFNKNMIWTAVDAQHPLATRFRLPREVSIFLIHLTIWMAWDAFQ